jgi:PTS system nitrogen regulatory IIA component
MKIEDFLNPADAIVGLRSGEKSRLLQELAEHAAGRLHMDAAGIASELLKREELGSTGVGNGVALPHARLQRLTKPFGAVASLKRPIDFDAIDHTPVDIVFLLLLPGDAGGEQLNALAAAARKLREPERRELLRAAQSSDALYRAMTD